MARVTIARVPIADTGMFMTMSVNRSSWLGRALLGELRLNEESVLRVARRFEREAALEINAMAAANLESSRKRRNITTGRLRNALLDSRNVWVRQDGRAFGAGRVSFLNKSEALYWRQIEEGSSVHVGQVLIGVWGSGISGQWIGPGAHMNRYGYYVATGPWRRHGGGRGQKFQPLSTLPENASIRTNWSSSSLFGGRTTATTGKVSRSGRLRVGAITPQLRTVVRKPIGEHGYYADALKQFASSRRAVYILRSAIASELGLRVQQVPRSYSAALALLADE